MRFAIEEESVSIIDGGYRGGLRLEILVNVGDILGLIGKTEHILLDTGYWCGDG